MGLTNLLTSPEAMISLEIVLRCLGRTVTIFALCCAIGLQWVALQSIAWTTMLVQNTKCAPLRVAISQTFDGAHPCSLCHIVNKGKSTERKSDTQLLVPKMDMMCVARTTQLMPKFSPFDYAIRNLSFFEIEYSPPVPPPRSV
jgi:hypothetical protein